LGNFQIITSSGTGITSKVTATGIFNVTEIVPEGWTLISNTCDDGSSTDAINVTSEEFVTCTFQNEKLTPPEPTEGFMTGGGHILAPSTLTIENNSIEDKKNNAKSQANGNFRLSHGFELHCNPEFLPNNLQVNWLGNSFHMTELISATCLDDNTNWLGNSFHMTELISATCLDDNTPNDPPKSPHPGPTLDVYVGEASGRFNGEEDAHAEWIFTDNGEPGKKDEIIKLIIKNSNDDVVLSIDETFELKGGNHQFVPHKSSHHKVVETSSKITNSRSGSNSFGTPDLPDTARLHSAEIVKIDDESNGSGGDEHLTRPTFGLSHETYDSVVEGGFKFNDQIFAVTDNHHTPFEEQSVSIGEINTFSATIYADKGLKVQEFLFGIPNVGDAHLAELGVEIWYGYNNEIDDVKAIQKSNVIDKESVIATHEKTKCQALDVEEKCEVTSISMIFLEPLKDKVMAIKAIDYKNRYQITYLNEGLDISGDSLNPMLTKMIPSNVKNEGLVQVTQTAKYSPYWVAEDGRFFEMNSFGSFNEIKMSFERFHDSGDPKTRMHSEFGGILDYEQKRALDVFNSGDLISKLPGSFTYNFLESSDRITDELKTRMLEQEKIAQEIIEKHQIQSRW
jgi:hypothetical protein